ncbi:ribose utilization transcriptional repressor RbsR [Pediococcus argentinicus]|uniref:LacI family transcription regulator n=1 Tax=Pediococcus argentinicus TaxID=480391 RepID=A0A0R2NJ43_9LACO|nr:substrate-binding domain-containing protein [Pediococcus argentinicus]KRO24619.1 LacI family transcription regulator [Pediococcus argentinicus]NKZ22805.1 LacI family transcriptional regulator [Pediococcus argentinicus]GEP19855.1 LacI family transcriptional regulator [Pediococcus argentinicus]
MKNKAVTIKDVAKQSGVSISTVSQILNGNKDKFGKKTVENVLQAKTDLKYEPDYFARRMIMKKSKTIGVLVPDITNPFFSGVIRGIEAGLYKENYATLLCNADLDNQKESAYLEELSRRGVDGFIIASSNISNEAINKTLQAKDRPFIVIDQKKAEGFSDAVLTDDFQGGTLAGQHLQKLGHRKIAVLMPSNPPENVKQRFEGFKDNFELSDLTVIDTDLTKEAGQKAVESILRTSATAIFAVNDEIAFGVYRGLAEAGKTIPDDYSVVGYDNVDMCEYMQPQLTTIAQPIFELGQTTAELLLERISNSDKEWEEKHLPVQMIERNSTTML